VPSAGDADWLQLCVGDADWPELCVGDGDWLAGVEEDGLEYLPDSGDGNLEADLVTAVALHRGKLSSAHNVTTNSTVQTETINCQN